MVFFFFVCGEYTFRSEVKGYEGVICQCHNCGNMSARVIKSRPFFTFCFVVSVSTCRLRYEKPPLPSFFILQLKQKTIC